MATARHIATEAGAKVDGKTSTAGVHGGKGANRGNGSKGEKGGNGKSMDGKTSVAGAQFKPGPQTQQNLCVAWATPAGAQIL